MANTSTRKSIRDRAKRRADQENSKFISDAEWNEMKQPKPELRGFLAKHIELPGLNWRRVQFAPTDDPDVAPFTDSFDLMGDGTMMSAMIREVTEHLGLKSSTAKRRVDTAIPTGEEYAIKYQGELLWFEQAKGGKTKPKTLRVLTPNGT